MDVALKDVHYAARQLGHHCSPYSTVTPRDVGWTPMERGGNYVVSTHLQVKAAVWW